MNELAEFKRECGIMVILIAILYFGLLLVVNNNRNEINTLRGQVLVVATKTNELVKTDSMTIDLTGQIVEKLKELYEED